MRITTKLLLLVTGIILLFLVANSFILTKHMRGYLQTSQLEWVKTLAQAISESVARDTIDGNRIRVRELLQKMTAADENIQYAFVTDMHGRLFAHSFDNGFPRFLAERLGSHDYDVASGYIHDIYDTRQGLIAEYDAPLIEGMIAHLHLGINQSRVSTLTKQVNQELIGLIALIGLGGIALALLIGWRISHPLLRFTEQLRLYSKNRETAFPQLSRSDPDIRQMIDTFQSIITARTRAEEALQEREQNLSLTLDSIGDAVIATDAAGRVTRMNPIAEELTAWQFPQAEGHPLDEVFPIINATTRQPIESPVDKVLATGEIVTLANHTTLIAKDGHEYQIADSAAPIRDKENNIIGVILVFHDVTEQYRLRQANEESRRQLQKSEARVRLLLDSTAEAIYGIDTEGNCTFANPACAQLLGYDSPTELLGRNMHELIHHSYPDGSAYPVQECHIYRAFQEKRGSHIDDEMLWRKDGTGFAAEYWSHPIFEDGECVGAVVTFLDITERKQAEKQLREKEQRLAEAQRMARIGSWELDLTNNKLEWSDEIYRIFEIDPEKFSASYEAFLQAIHPEDRERVNAAYTESLKNRTPYRIEHRLRMPNGAIKYVHEYCKTYYDAEGNPVRSLGTVQDITERVSMEEALRRSQKMEAIGQLSGGIAHDFNNQLGVIIGYLDFLQDRFANEEKPRQWINKATTATLRCMDLTRQLLTFSRRRQKKKVVVNLNTVINDLNTMIARSVTPEVEIQYFLAEDLWQTEVDPGEFQDAILNMTINARDAMPNGGKLLIETTNKILDEGYTAINPGVKAGEYVQLMLSDTGTGMSREVLEHVFEPFFTTKPEGKGTGLGLAMVYGFVRRYDGYIKIYSEPGMGTTIRIYLPRTTSAAPVTTIETSQEAVLPRGNETILVVDDEVDLLQLADQYLSDLGYRVHLAKNATEALKTLAGDETIDLLFSDVVMPGGINGYELAQKAEELQPGIKILLTSGFTSKTIAKNGLARFSTNLLSKPYRKQDVVQRIREVLDKKEET